MALRAAKAAPKPFPTEKGHVGDALLYARRGLEAQGLHDVLSGLKVPEDHFDACASLLIPHLRREAMMGGPHGLRAFLALLEQGEHGISDRDLRAIGVSLAREWEAERRAMARPAPLSGRPPSLTVIDGGAS